MLFGVRTFLILVSALAVISSEGAEVKSSESKACFVQINKVENDEIQVPEKVCLEDWRLEPNGTKELNSISIKVDGVVLKKEGRIISLTDERDAIEAVLNSVTNDATNSDRKETFTLKVMIPLSEARDSTEGVPELSGLFTFNPDHWHRSDIDVRVRYILDSWIRPKK